MIYYYNWKYSYTRTPCHRQFKRLFSNYGLDTTRKYDKVNQHWLKRFEYDYYFFTPNYVRSLVENFEDNVVPAANNMITETSKETKEFKKPVGLPITKAVQAPLSTRTCCSNKNIQQSKLPIRSATTTPKTTPLKGSSKALITSNSLMSKKSSLKRARSTTDIVRNEYITPNSYTAYEGAFTKDRFGNRDCVREIIKHFEGEWSRL